MSWAVRIENRKNAPEDYADLATAHLDETYRRSTRMKCRGAETQILIRIFLQTLERSNDPYAAFRWDLASSIYPF